MMYRSLIIQFALIIANIIFPSFAEAVQVQWETASYELAEGDNTLMLYAVLSEPSSEAFSLPIVVEGTAKEAEDSNDASGEFLVPSKTIDFTAGSIKSDVFYVFFRSMPGLTGNRNVTLHISNQGDPLIDVLQGSVVIQIIGAQSEALATANGSTFKKTPKNVGNLDNFFQNSTVIMDGGTFEEGEATKEELKNSSKPHHSRSDNFTSEPQGSVSNADFTQDNPDDDVESQGQTQALADPMDSQELDNSEGIPNQTIYKEDSSTSIPDLTPGAPIVVSSSKPAPLEVVVPEESLEVESSGLPFYNPSSDSVAKYTIVFVCLLITIMFFAIIRKI